VATQGGNKLGGAADLEATSSESGPSSAAGGSILEQGTQ
jgi:hypothetical protein